MASEPSERLTMRAADLLLTLVLVALGLLLVAAVQALLRRMAEDALARSLVSTWLAARAEEWVASPYGSPIAPSPQRLAELISEAGLKSARPVFALRHRVCLEVACPGADAFREVDAATALLLRQLPQWEEAEFALEVELPSGLRERLGARLRRSPLTAGATERVASATLLPSE